MVKPISDSVKENHVVNDEKSAPSTAIIASNLTAHIPYGIPCVRELLRFQDSNSQHIHEECYGSDLPVGSRLGFMSCSRAGNSLNEGNDSLSWELASRLVKDYRMLRRSKRCSLGFLMIHKMFEMLVFGALQFLAVAADRAFRAQAGEKTSHEDDESNQLT
ncbi:hypothetical protein WUBG_05789 [Wuchereria bancrofti]|uniref:Uncharacterized protein n=1 Tax=Wuchereria bancrofti TaxID=6293 RepID=J9F1H5_WUCBA|nr:hypothetical protein WUBG_05789 [Wuchereria bancrofti]